MAKTSNTSSRTPVAPDLMLIALVAQFLERNGFKSAHRIFNTERKKRPKKEGWQGTFARDYTAKLPTLETIFKTWKDEISKEVNSNNDSESETSDSDTGDSALEAANDSGSSDGEENSDRAISQGEPDGSSESDSNESADEDEMDAITKGAADRSAIISSARSLKRKASPSSSESTGVESSSSGGSDIDSNDESRPVKRQKVETQSSDSESKNGANSSSDSNSVSDSDSDSDSALESGSDSDLNSDSSSSSDGNMYRAKKNLKPAINAKHPQSDESSSEDSSDSGSSSIEEEISVQKTLPALDQAASDSSGTIVGDMVAAKHASEPSSAGAAIQVKQITVTKKQRHIGAQPTRLAALSATADMNGFVSNDYVSYDYADKAYHDLSVTRGKGFTKEKNKKKRGSYRGGTIDTAGGKGFKFDD